MIRWSDDGNSFIVLDEDEFAKTLIPELFKHNNYASFVRQLNMYGFHKKVGLSDNSMRASERKNKSPSEYSNPYFKRGHPDLLWLIQKPKNVPGGGSKSGKGSRVKTEEAEDNEGDDYGADGDARDDRNRKQLSLGGAQGFLPKEQLAGVYRELQAIRQQQQIISSTINKLRREHEQLYAQAANFQEQHTRHENSINAILTFLATVYNRSLQGHEGTQNIANSFAGAIPQDQGNVVDMGDEYALSTLGADMNSPGGQRSAKKQPLLLKAPPTAPDRHGRASTLSPSGSSTYDQSRRSSHARQPSTSQSGHVEEVFDVNSPRQKVPQQNQNQNQRYPQRDIMSVIQNSNARNGLPTTTFADFPNVLSSLETSGGNAPLTPNQRADMLRLMANETNSADPSVSASSNNALVTPTPPPMPQNYTGRLASTRAEIDNLAKMQAEQDRSVQNLTNLLQPLSPTGTIPGLGDDNAGGTIPPPPLDLDQIFNSSDYFTDIPDIDKSGLNFGDPAAGQNEPAVNPGVDASKDANDLFDFDNLPAGPEGDLFDDGNAIPNQQPQPQPQPQPQAQPQPQQNTPGYFNGYDGAGAGFNNGTVGGGTDPNLAGNMNNDAGRIVETFTDSDAPSPANTVDENVQLNVPNAGSESGGGKGSNGPSVKRRKKA